MVSGYCRKALSSRCAVKIDLEKAFDSVNCRFLFQVLRVMNISEAFIKWIEGCMATPSFSLVLNGMLDCYFRGNKSLRQEDPLPLYLFVIVIEVLTKLLDYAALSKIFSFHPKCKKVCLTHLAFLDDLLILTKGKLSFIIGVQHVLSLFYQLFGL